MHLMLSPHQQEKSRYGGGGGGGVTDTSIDGDAVDIDRDAHGVDRNAFDVDDDCTTSNQHKSSKTLHHCSGYSNRGILTGNTHTDNGSNHNTKRASRSINQRRTDTNSLCERGDFLKHLALQRVRGWPSPLIDMIAHTPPSLITGHPIYDRDPSRPLPCEQAREAAQPSPSLALTATGAHTTAASHTTAPAAHTTTAVRKRTTATAARAVTQKTATAHTAAAAAATALTPRVVDIATAAAFPFPSASAPAFPSQAEIDEDEDADAEAQNRVRNEAEAEAQPQSQPRSHAHAERGAGGSGGMSRERKGASPFARYVTLLGDAAHPMSPFKAQVRTHADGCTHFSMH